ncbi:unnamed protein product [Trichogramma brassicae]|uniref:Uncharacterized protein n=1 Tax=Trichogramma brassicae TaxID=86971 RepID=A0A6H5IF83_9HYME|nr:unnamed protein product [Trichogramma brassicae]
MLLLAQQTSHLNWGDRKQQQQQQKKKTTTTTTTKKLARCKSLLSPLARSRGRGVDACLTGVGSLHRCTRFRSCIGLAVSKPRLHYPIHTQDDRLLTYIAWRYMARENRIIAAAAPTIASSSSPVSDRKLFLTVYSHPTLCIYTHNIILRAERQWPVN